MLDCKTSLLTILAGAAWSCRTTASVGPHIPHLSYRGNYSLLQLLRYFLNVSFKARARSWSCYPPRISSDGDPPFSSLFQQVLLDSTMWYRYTFWWLITSLLFPSWDSVFHLGAEKSWLKHLTFWFPCFIFQTQHHLAWWKLLEHVKPCTSLWITTVLIRTLSLFSPFWLRSQ